MMLKSLVQGLHTENHFRRTQKQFHVLNIL